MDPCKGIIFSKICRQNDVHKVYSGIVPRLASNEHFNNFEKIFKEILKITNLNKITIIAVTCGPGLSSCLAIGVSFAKALALTVQSNVVGINHLRGHAWSPFIQIHKSHPDRFKKKIEKYLPHLGLLVSGGNTLLLKIDKDHNLKIIAKTKDDATGEVLDKGARLLNLKYPGSLAIEEKALNGNMNYYFFPRSYVRNKNKIMKFSFSGLKTSLRYLLKDIERKQIKPSLFDICCSYQTAVIDHLIHKTYLALSGNLYKSIGVSGGVSNNKKLYFALSELSAQFNIPLITSGREYSSDNAAMIGFAAYIDKNNKFNNKSQNLDFYPKMSLALPDKDEGLNESTQTLLI